MLKKQKKGIQNLQWNPLQLFFHGLFSVSVAIVVPCTEKLTIQP